MLLEEKHREQEMQEGKEDENLSDRKSAVGLVMKRLIYNTSMVAFKRTA